MLYYSNMSNWSYQALRDVSLGLLVGLLSGLFGIGGGIVLVPLLVLILKTAQKSAQATSLVVVAFSAVLGAVTYGVEGSVFWQGVPLLILGGLVGTWAGSNLVRRTPDKLLTLGFGILLIVVAIQIGLDAWLTSPSAPVPVNSVTALGYLAAGLAMGFFSVFFGLGGGVIVVPLLIGVFGFSQQLAAGTSLTVMIPVTLLGALRLTSAGFTNWGQGIRIGSVAAFSAIGGALLALATDPSALQIAFAAVLIFAGAQMIWRARK